MTKAELEEYVDELERAIENAVGALDEYDFKQAKAILDEYVEEEEPEAGEEEPEEGEEPEEEEKGGEE